MFEAAVSGARTDEIEGVEVVVRPALTAAAVDVLEADACLEWAAVCRLGGWPVVPARCTGRVRSEDPGYRIQSARPGLSSAIMPRLLVVHHTPSPALQEMFEAAVSGARTDEIEGVEVVVRPALTAVAVDVLEADAYLLGTPANIGYMSGALKHFFDGIYYPCLEATRRRPYGLYVHGASDTGGAVRAVESIATGLQWRKVRPPVCVTGAPSRPDLEACWELGALLAAEIAG
jgi:hypothetical protein